MLGIIGIFYLNINNHTDNSNSQIENTNNTQHNFVNCPKLINDYDDLYHNNSKNSNSINSQDPKQYQKDKQNEVLNQKFSNKKNDINDLKNINNTNNGVPNNKKQIVVIIVAAKSLTSNEIKVKDHEEYEVSKFYVVEQMKITAKELKPKAIFNAISNSNKSFSFLHNGFCVFTKGDHQSPLYKKLEVISIESSTLLTHEKLFYLFANNFNDFVVTNDTNTRGLTNNLVSSLNTEKNNAPKFKKLNFSWKKPSRGNKNPINSTELNKEGENSQNSDRNNKEGKNTDSINNLPNSKITDKKIGIANINDRKIKYSILNSMQTIKEVDSFNTSAFNVTMNTNNLGSGGQNMIQMSRNNNSNLGGNSKTSNSNNTNTNNNNINTNQILT